MPSVEGPSESIISGFTTKLKQRKFESSRDLAVSTVKLLEQTILETEWKNARELMDKIGGMGKRLLENAPSEAVIGNITRIILKMIRDEYASLHKGKHEESELQDSLQKILMDDQADFDYTADTPLLEEGVIDRIKEYMTELETSVTDISAQALEHIHANEIIMTMGSSKTVFAFLKNAAKDRVFQVIVAEGAPSYQGHKLAANLAKEKIQTTLIPDSAIFAMMARVNIVIIGTHSVMANGGLKAVIGTHSLALAAKHYSVPMIVCAPMFKLCPEFVFSMDQDGFNEFGSPEEILSGSEGQLTSRVKIYNPIFDYVPPSLVTLFISNMGGDHDGVTSGGHSPSYIYRLVSEVYHHLDVEL